MAANKGILLICPACKAELTYSTKAIICKGCGCGPIDPALADRVVIDDKIKALLLSYNPILQGVLFPYLAFFRSYNKDGRPNPLQAKTVLRLLREIKALYEQGWVRHTKKYRDLPTRPADFAVGMERMLAVGLRNLPLKDHNYLRNVVWGMVEEQGASAEAAHREQEATGHVKVATSSAQLMSAAEVSAQQNSGKPCRNVVTGEEDNNYSVYDQAYIDKYGMDAFQATEAKGLQKAFAVKLKKVPQLEQEGN